MYVDAKRTADTAATALDAAKAALVGLGSHAKEEGEGVSVTRFLKKGPIEYKRVPELAGVDLEP